MEIKRIIRKIKNRGTSLSIHEDSPNRFKIYKIYAFILMLITGTALSYILLNDGLPIINGLSLLNFILFFFMSVSFFAVTYYGSLRLQKNTNNEDWFYNKGKLFMLSKICFFFLGVFNFSTLLNTINSVALIIVALLSYILFWFIVYYIYKNPILLIKNKIYQNIGTMLMTIGFYTMLISFFAVIVEGYSSYFNIWFWTIPIIFFTIIDILTNNDNNNLNEVQLSVLKLIRPGRLIFHLKKEEGLEIFYNKALKLLKKNKGLNKREIEYALMRILNEKYNTNKNSSLNIIISTVIFISIVIITISIEDTLYLNYIKPILCNWNLTLCN